MEIAQPRREKARRPDFAAAAAESYRMLATRPKFIHF